MPSRLAESSAYLSRFQLYSRMTGVAPKSIRACWREIQSDSRLLDGLATQALLAEEGDSTSSLGASIRSSSLVGRVLSKWRFSPANAELYSLVRALRPSIAVETGVASGVSTTLILRALERNGRGELFSVDLPSYEKTGYVNLDGQLDHVHLPGTKAPGWLVPNRLRSSWELNIGSSTDLLGPLLARLGRVDFFFHDSDHSYDVMMLEFKSAWRAMSSGSVLYSDDISWNAAFRDFSTEIRTNGIAGVTPVGRGIIRKVNADDDTHRL